MSRNVGHQDLEAKLHRRKFRLDGTKAQARCAAALKVLVEQEEPIGHALLALGQSRGSLLVVQAALELLIHGEKKSRAA